MDRDAVVNMALAIPDQAKTIVAIKTTSDYESAARMLLAIKEIRKKIESVFKPIKQKMDAAKKEVMDQEKAADAPLKEAEAWIKPLMVSYDTEQEAIRVAEQRRLQEEARKRDEDERMAAALAAEMDGDIMGAEEILNEDAFVPPVIVSKAIPTVQGISYREVWKYQVTDIMELVRAVAKGTVPISAIQANDVFLGQQVRSMKSIMNYPGVKVWAEKTLAAGKR